MSLDYYTTDEDREKFIKKVEDDEYLLYGIREKCRDYVDFLERFTTATRKDLLAIDSAEEAVRIHGDVSGISKLLHAFGSGLDQSVMNEPTEIDLKDWANLSLFRVAIIRRKFSAAKIFVEKTGSAEYLIKLETLLHSIHKFLTTGDWDEDEVEMLEQEKFFDASFLNEQVIIGETPTMATPPPPKKVEKKEKEKGKKKKKNGENEEEKEIVAKEEKDNEEEIQVKESEVIEEKEIEGGEEVKEKEEEEEEEKDDSKSSSEESESKENGEEESKDPVPSLGADLKKKAKTPNIDRRSNFIQVKRKSFSNLFRGKVSTPSNEDKGDLSHKESYLRDSISVLEYKAKKFSWQKRWLILNLENIEIYKDEKSVSLSKSIPLSSLTKIEEPTEEFDLYIPSTFGLGKKNVRVTNDVFEGEDNAEKKIFVVEANIKNSISNYCFQAKNNRDMLKWLITLDSLIELNRTPLIDSSLKLKYLTSNESHTNTGIVQNDAHSWKYDGKRFKLKNRNANLSFTWSGERLKQRGGENIGTLEWNGVSLKWSKYENVKFTWIEADKEFLVQAGENSHSWNYNGESLYRKDDKTIAFSVKNRPPIGIILAVCVISSFLSNIPLWEVATPKTPGQRNEEIIANKKAGRVRKGILGGHSSKSRLGFSSRKRVDEEKEKEKEENNSGKEENGTENEEKGKEKEGKEKEESSSSLFHLLSPRARRNKVEKKDEKLKDKEKSEEKDEEEDKDEKKEKKTLSPRSLSITKLSPMLSPRRKNEEDKKEEKDKKKDGKEKKDVKKDSKKKEKEEKSEEEKEEKEEKEDEKEEKEEKKDDKKDKKKDKKDEKKEEKENENNNDEKGEKSDDKEKKDDKKENKEEKEDEKKTEVKGGDKKSKNRSKSIKD